MADNQPFNIHVDGLEKIAERLKQLPKAIGEHGVAAASSYLIGVLVNKEVPPYKYITRAQAPWASDKQRRFVMASIRDGRIKVPYQRGGKAGPGIQGYWAMERSSDNQVMIANRKLYAKWLYGSDQSRRHGLIGWKRITRILMEYNKNILQAFERGVVTAIKKLGLG